jgi:hypothetical protein
MMKNLLLLFTVFVFTFTVFSQSKVKKTKINKKPTLAQLMVSDVKKLTPIQKDIYLNTLKKLDGADTEFAINKNKQTYFLNIQKAQTYFLNNTEKLPHNTLAAGFGLLMLNYEDASVLFNLYSIKQSSENNSIEFTDEQTIQLGEIQKRYKDLLLISDMDGLLDPEIISTIYVSAMSLKKGMYSYLEK